MLWCVCVWIVEIALGVFYRGPKSIPMAFASSKAKKELVVIMEEALGNEQIFCHIILSSIILSSHTTRKNENVACRHSKITRRGMKIKPRCCFTHTHEKVLFFSLDNKVTHYYWAVWFRWRKLHGLAFSECETFFLRRQNPPSFFSTSEHIKWK